jgi:hypothetical protein
MGGAQIAATRSSVGIVAVIKVPSLADLEVKSVVVV